MIEYIEIKEEEEIDLEGVVVKQVKEDGHLRSLFIKDNLGKSYKIRVGDSYSKSLSVMQPKPITIKKYKLTMWVDREEDIKKEFDLETEVQATTMKLNLERTNEEKNYEYEIEEVTDERFTIIDEAI